MSSLARLCAQHGCTTTILTGTRCPRHQQDWATRTLLIQVGFNPASIDAALASMPDIPDWSLLL